MKEDYTKIVVILDASGSMRNKKVAALNGFNEFMQDQKRLDGQCDVTFVQFNSYGRSKIICQSVDIQEMSELTNTDYICYGLTALLDAVGHTISNLEDEISQMDEDQKPSKVLVLIITDGDENDSKDFLGEQIKDMIEHHKEESDWQFVYIGANQDAFAVGKGMSINTAYNMDDSSDGIMKALHDTSRSTKMYRSAAVGAQFSYAPDDTMGT